MISARFRALTRNVSVFRGSAFIAGVIKVQKDHAQTAIKRLQKYPPQPSGSTYIRTYQLRNSWSINGPRVNQSGIITTISNSAPYAVFVHGNESGEGQVRIHQGRWITMQEALDREGYISDLREVMRNAVVG